MMREEQGEAAKSGDGDGGAPLLSLLPEVTDVSEAAKRLSRFGGSCCPVFVGRLRKDFGRGGGSSSGSSISFEEDAAEQIEEAKRRIKRVFTKEEIKTLTTGDFVIRCPSAAQALALASSAKATSVSTGAAKSRPTAASSSSSLSVSSSDRAVVATFRHEEATVQIKIVTPPSFPVAKVAILCEKRHGVTEDKWLLWQRHMMQLIGGQGSSGSGTLNALLFFKAELDALFANVEPCSICYGVISTTNRSLPNQRCGTCKHAFHRSPCLSQWFASSHAATCPMCRSLFK
jgi:Ring finger domain